LRNPVRFLARSKKSSINLTTNDGAGALVVDSLCTFRLNAAWAERWGCWLARLGVPRLALACADFARRPVGCHLVHEVRLQVHAQPLSGIHLVVRHGSDLFPRERHRLSIAQVLGLGFLPSPKLFDDGVHVHF
jgi:hypothetical protein